MIENCTIVLEAVDLCHSGLRPLTLKVARGEIFGILGKRQSGKTAAFNLLSGKTSPSSGRLQIFGKDFWRHERALRHLVGACASPEHDINTPGLQSTAREHLNFEAGLLGISHQKYRDRIDEVLAFVGLRQHDALTVASLPHDMRRKLALARSLLTQPDLVLIDEPTAGVAEKRCEPIWNLLHALQKEGKTIVLTTSSWQEVQEVCNRVAPLREGELQEVIAP